MECIEQTATATTTTRHVPDRFTAGFRLLDKFGTQWEHIHRMSESNTKKAKYASLKLDALDRACDERLVDMDHFIASFKSLSKIAEQIDSISGDLQKLEDYFSKIEDNLLLLRLRREQIFTERYIRNVEGNHEAQVQLVKIQAELRKDRLMSEHFQRVQNFEKEEQQKLEDRRRILERNFEDEKNRYLEQANSKQQPST